MKEHILYSFKKYFSKRPAFLIFFATNRCNLACGHCFYSQTRASSESDLSLEEINAFSKELGRLLEIDLSGGEPFAREDLYQIYEILVRNNNPAVIAIPTNGTLTDKICADTSKMLEHGGPQHLTVILSIDGPREMHDRIRGGAAYDHVINTYHRLAALKRRHARLHMRANTVVSNQNITSLQALHSELTSQMPELDMHDLEIMRGTPADSRFQAPDIEQLEALRPVILDIFKHYTQKGSSFWRSRIEFRVRQKLFDAYLGVLASRGLKWPCWAGRLHCVIDHSGDVSFCERMPAIGNLRRKSFGELWQSEAARQLRSEILEKRCACIHSCFQTANLTFNQRYWPGLLL